MNKINTIGIIAEYNPFHKGHLYQVEQAKLKSGAQNVVAIISGSIVQRGDFAIFDKMARAEMAVKNGVNLVIEMPCVYSGQTAEIFANGGVDILNSLGIVDGISFGVENDNLDSIIKLAEILLKEEEPYKDALAKNLSDGMGFPAARSKALKEIYNIDFADTPNNILAIEYAKAIIKNNYKMEMVPVLRKGSLHDNIGSASYIRSLLENGEDFSEYIPGNIWDIILNETPVFLKQFSDVILYKLRTMTPDGLSQIADVSEGIENRIITCAEKSSNVFELIEQVGTKRYSNARIRRILINTLIGIKKEDIQQKPQYIRVLAADQKGTTLLRNIKGKCHLPVITKLTDAPDLPQLALETKATSVYYLGAETPSGEQFKKSPKIIKKN